MSQAYYFFTLILAAFFISKAKAFQSLFTKIPSSSINQAHQYGHRRHRASRYQKSILRDAVSDVQEVLKEEYTIFYNLIMSKSDGVWKDLGGESEDDGKFTIFAPNDEAMNKLGDKRLVQLLDDRNRETTEKIAAFHVIKEPVGAWDLINSGGIVTVGGEVPVGKSKIGGFFGFGGKEDGGVTVNGSKILNSKQVGNCLVHEMDGLISLQLLWRYMDQIRIL